MNARAAEIDVVAREVVVRSAPFDVAPEVARVHAGDKLSGDDQASGDWRFVKLPDGRGGYLHQADVKIATPPPPGAAPPGVPASPPAPQTAQVTALELGVRSAPGADAPVTRMLYQNDQVVVLPELKDGWRSVQLADGQTGFVQEAGLKMDVAAPVPAPVAIAAAPESVAAAPPQSPSDHPDAQLGLLFELLPTGTLTASESGYSLTSDTSVTVAVAPFVDFPLSSPYVSLGFSPQFVFGVKGTSATNSATEYDLRARLTGRYPVSAGGAIYGRLSPAYSIISLPYTGSSISNPSGFLLDVSAGAEIVVNPKLSIVLELGYQVGFQSTTDTTRAAEEDVKTRFLHLGAGFLLPL
jgi:hypothetical protein